MGGLNFPTLDAAISKAEGYGTPGAIPTRAYNPGDIIAGPFATQHGATGSVTAAGGQQIATFPDFTTGQAAEDALITSNYAGGDITALAQGWLAGSSSETQANWSQTVADALGVPASTPVNQLRGGADPLKSVTASQQGYTAPDWVSSVLNKLTGSKGVPGQANTASTGLGRLAAGIVGLIFIAGGIFALKGGTVTIAGTGVSVPK